MSDARWQIVAVIVALVVAMAFGSSNSPTRCESMCAPRGVHTYVDTTGRCECEAFVK